MQPFFIGCFVEKFLQIISRPKAKSLGMKRYFTGKPCKHGHISERNIKSSACSACQNEIFKEWSKNNPGADAALAKRWRKDNAERYRQVQRRGYKKWIKINKQKHLVYMRNANSSRREKIKGKIPASMYFDFISKAKKICHYCEAECFNDFHVDHFYPLSKGGSHSLCNLVIACPCCNLSKGASSPYSFINKINQDLIINL